MDVVITVAPFECQTPNIGTTYRSNNINYRFNYNSIWQYYRGLGINAQVRLFYQGDGSPEQEYTATVMPDTAQDYVIDIPVYDIVNFRLEFLLEGGSLCSKIFNIPYSAIVT